MFVCVGVEVIFVICCCLLLEVELEIFVVLIGYFCDEGIIVLIGFFYCWIVCMDCGVELMVVIDGVDEVIVVE